MDGLVRRFRKYRETRQTIRRNKELCKKYPFLIPWNRFTGKPITENCGDLWKYNWMYTELDDMPKGWRKRFGEQMCVELRTALIGDEDLDRWRIVQMKEKYGELCLYDNGHKPGSCVPSIIDKYALISRYTCIVCGADATRVTRGWIAPYCDKCCPDAAYDLIAEAYKEEEEIE